MRTAALLVADANPEDNPEDSLENDAQSAHEPAARIAGGPALPHASAERLACTARPRALVTDRARNPLYLGRTRRLVSKTLLAAPRFRDHNHCQYPGCTHTRWLHALTRHNPPIPDDPLTPTWTGERLDPTPILTRLLPELDQQAA